MKKVTRQFKQTLSILLAVAMIVTMIPETSAIAFAAEPEVESQIDTEDSDFEEQTVEEETEEELEDEESEEDDEKDPKDEIAVESLGEVDEEIGELEEPKVTFTVSGSLSAAEDADATNHVTIKKLDGTAIASGDQVEVTSGDSLQFTVEVDDEVQLKTVKHNTSYDVDSELLNGKTVYTLSSIEADDTVVVTVADLEEATATFAGAGDTTTATLTTDFDIKQVTSIGDGTLGSALSGTEPTLTGRQSKSISFTIESKDVKSVTSITAKDSSTKAAVSVTKTEDGVYDYTYYTVPLGENGVTITITSAVDATLGNGISITKDGPADSYGEITVKSADTAVTTKVGEKYITKADAPTVDIVVKEGYTLKKAVQKIGETEVELTTANGKLTSAGEDDITYTATLAIDNTGESYKDVTLELTTEGTAASAEATVTFENNGADTAYSVLTSDDIAWDKKANTCSIGTTATELGFTVTVPATVTPVVNYYDSAEYSNAFDTSSIDALAWSYPVTLSYTGTPVSTTLTGGVAGKIYTYYISAGYVNETGDVIVIDQEDLENTLTINYNNTEVSYVVKDVDADSEETVSTGGSSPNNADTVTIKESRVYSITVTAKDNCSITGVTKTVGTGSEETMSGTDGVYTFTAPEGENVTITIKSEGSFGYSLKKNTSALESDEDIYDAGANKYSIALDTTATYTTEMLKGTTAQTLKTAEVTGGTEDASSATLNSGNSNKSATLTLSAKDAGKTLTVTLTDDFDNSVSYSIYIYPTLTSVAISGVELTDKKATIEMPVDSEKELTFSLTPSSASYDNISVTGATDEVTVSNIDADGKLTITAVAGKTAKDAAATLKITDTSVDKGSGYKTDDEVLATLTIKTVKPALTSVTPTVSTKDVDHDYITLTVGAPDTVVQPAAGNVYYKVVATRTITGISSPTAVTQYFKKDADATSQDVKFDLEKAYDALTQAEKDKIETLDDYKTSGETYGAGETYTVKVTLVQTPDQTKLENDASLGAGKESFTSATTADLSVETKAPYYETNLTLAAGTTTLASGVQNAKVATAQFSENTTYKKLSVVESGIVYAKNNVAQGDEDSVIAVDIDGTDILASVGGLVEAGSYAITIAAASGDALASTASITVKVVKGGSDVTLNVPSYQIYKQANKAATLKVTTTVKAADGTKPKSSKVTYTLLDGTGKELTDKNANEYIKNAVSAKTLSISASGAIKLTKDFQLSAKAADNQFCVKVTVNDTGISDTSAPITITNEAIVVSDVAVIKETSTKGIYEVIAKGGESLSHDQIQDAYLVVFKNSNLIDAGKKYTAAEIQKYAADPYNLSLKYNTKVLSISPIDDGGNKLAGVAFYFDYVAVKEGKNLSVVVTAADGGKSKVTLSKLNITFSAISATGDFGLRIYEENSADDITKGKYTEGEVSFTGTSNSVLHMDIMAKGTDGQWNQITSLYDLKVSAKNAKIVYSSYNRYDIVTSKKNVTVTLTYKKADGTKASYSYNIINKGIVDTKAPAIKATNTLSNTAAIQTLGLSINDKKNSWAGYTVKVEVDSASLNKAKSAVAYKAFQTAILGSEGEQQDWVTADSKLQYLENNNFNLSLGNNTVPAGSYKLIFTLGHIDKATGDFIPETKSVTTTVKVAKNKVVKTVCDLVQTDIILSTKSTTGVELTFSGSNYTDAAATGVYNKNLNGTINKFKTYFEVKTVNKTKVLKLKDNLTVEQLEKLTDDDLTGFIQYQYKDAAGQTQTNTAQVTVTLTDTPEGYTVAGVSTVKAATTTASVSVTLNDKAVTLSDAYVSEGVFATADTAVNGNVINLTSTTAAVGEAAVTLYFIPADSPYADTVSALKAKIAEAAAGSAKTTATQNYADAITKYGIQAAVTINVLDGDSTSGKISVADEDLTLAFAATDYDVQTETYVVYVPYTMLVQSTVGTVKSDSKLVLAAKETVDGVDYIKLSVTKAALDSAVTASTAAYGGLVDTKVTVGFSDSKVDESFDFAVTLPAKASKTYTEAVNDLVAAKSTIEGAVSVEYYAPTENLGEKVLTGTAVGSWTEEQIEANKFIGITVNNAIAAVEEEIAKYVPADSGVVVDMTQRTANVSDSKDYDIKVAAADITVPTSQKAGKLIINVTLNDKDETPANTNKLTYELTIPKTEENPADFADALAAFIAAKEDVSTTYYATNDTTADIIASDAREALELSKYETLVLTVTNVEISEAQVRLPGSITGTITVKSIKTGKSISDDFDFTIAALDNLTSAKTAITSALSDANTAGTWKTLTEDNVASTVLGIAQAAVNNPDITVEWAKTSDASPKDDVTLTPIEARSDVGSNGKIDGTLKLTLGTSLTDTLTVAETFTYNDIDTLITNISNNVFGADSSYDKLLAICAESNDSDTIKAAILTKANEVAAADKYKVVYAQDEEVEQAMVSLAVGDDVFSYTPASYKAGSISFTLNFIDILSNADNDTVENGKEIAVPETSVPALANATQSLSDAITVINEYIASDDYMTLIDPYSTDENKAAAPARADIVAATAPALKALLYSGNTLYALGVTVDKTATATAEGQVTITYTVKDSSGATQSGTPEALTIIKRDVGKSASATAAETAMKAIEITNDDHDSSTKQTAKQNELLEAAKAAVNPDLYDVIIIPSTGDLSITDANTVLTAGNGTATIGIRICVKATYNSETSSTYEDKTVSLVVYKPQTLEEAATEADKVVNKTTANSALMNSVTNATDADAILTEVKKVISEHYYDAKFGTANGEKFTRQEATSDAAGSITGTIYISYKDTDKTETKTVTVNLEIEQLPGE